MTATFIVFDTETTGLPVRVPRGAPPVPADDPRQPRLASFAAIIADELGEEITRCTVYIKPEGWTMAEFDARAIAEGKKPASEVNGLTDAFLNEHGKPVSEALDLYTDLILEGLTAVAFNAVFDLKIMRSELRRAGRDDLRERTKYVCAMRGLDPFGKDGLPISRGFIKLQEACDYFGIPLDNHEVMSDTVGALELLKIIISAGVLPDPKIVTNRNHPAQKRDAQLAADPRPDPKPMPPSGGTVKVPDSF